jgi:hypothetical protein
MPLNPSFLTLLVTIFAATQQQLSHQVQKVAKQRALATCDPSFYPNRTVEDILKACKDKLTENALSKEYWMIPSEGNSETKYDYVAETRTFVLSSIESKGRTGSLYLCGRPGTGKVCNCLPFYVDSPLICQPSNIFSYPTNFFSLKDYHH